MSAGRSKSAKSRNETGPSMATDGFETYAQTEPGRRTNYPDVRVYFVRVDLRNEPGRQIYPFRDICPSSGFVCRTTYHCRHSEQDIYSSRTNPKEDPSDHRTLETDAMPRSFELQRPDHRACRAAKARVDPITDDAMRHRARLALPPAWTCSKVEAAGRVEGAHRAAACSRYSTGWATSKVGA